MHQPVMSWGNAFSTCMHKPVRCMHQPVMPQSDACTYSMGSKVSTLSRVYLYSSYFGLYLLPGLWELVVPVATANIMVPHSVPKQKHSKGIAIYLD